MRIKCISVFGRCGFALRFRKFSNYHALLTVRCVNMVDESVIFRLSHERVFMSLVKKVFPFAMLSAFVFVTLMPADVVNAEIWTDDMDAALKQAKSENKDVLIDFTGSDWCGWCIKLDNEVFDKPLFKTQAPREFVLVKLDFPQDKSKLPEAIQEQNQQWLQKLGVQGFPTIVLLDSDGRPYAQTGYQEGGPEKYLASLKKLQQQRVERDKLMTEAAKASGDEKAKLLDQALSTMPPAMALNYFSDSIKQIIASDPENKLGLKEKYEGQLFKYEQMKTIESVAKKLEPAVGEMMQAGDHAGVIKKLDEMIAQHSDEKIAEQFLTFIKANIQFEAGDMQTGIATLDAAKKIMPNSEIAKQIDQIKQQLMMMGMGQGKPQGPQPQQP